MFLWDTSRLKMVQKRLELLGSLNKLTMYVLTKWTSEDSLLNKFFPCIIIYQLPHPSLMNKPNILYLNKAQPYQINQAYTWNTIITCKIHSQPSHEGPNHTEQEHANQDPLGDA